jgi:hypothetical protein
MSAAVISFCFKLKVLEEVYQRSCVHISAMSLWKCFEMLVVDHNTYGKSKLGNGVSLACTALHKNLGEGIYTS